MNIDIDGLKPLDSQKNQEQKEIKAGISDDLVLQYKAFSEFLGFQPKKIYYPCCANDVSPSEGFPGSQITYVDKDESSIKALKTIGLSADCMDVKEYNPGSIDLLILLNPGISPKIPVSYVVDGGYVLCNDWHQTATDLHNDSQFDFIGGINRRSDGYFVDTESIGEYWQVVETDEEWKKTKFSWGDMGFDQAANIVGLVTGKKDNVVVEFNKLVAKKREEEKIYVDELIKENPQMAEMLKTLYLSDEFTINVDGRVFVINAKLPNKKGTTEDLLIFRKKLLVEK